MADETILVVDDSPTILKLVELTLTKAGYRVATADGGESGIRSARERPPGLVLLDYVMPDLAGDDVCRTMSEEAALCAVPVIVMSAREDVVGERFGHMPNVADYLTKPFSPDALLAVVGHTLDKRARKAADGASPEPLALEKLPAAPEAADPNTAALARQTALSGDLEIIAIADILSLLRDQVQTGVLTLARGETRIEVFLRAGMVDFASARGVPDEFLLGRFLVDGGLVEAEMLAAVIEERKRDPEGARLLGSDLVERKLLSAAGLRKAMSFQTSALVYEGLRWGSGRFWFLAGADSSAAAREAALAMPVDALVMEGLRRVDEWRLIEREIGDFDQIFVRDEDKLAAFGRARLLREEIAVLEFVSGKNSVKDIVYLSRMGSFDVSKMLFRLLRSKLIRRRVAAIAV